MRMFRPCTVALQSTTYYKSLNIIRITVPFNVQAFRPVSRPFLGDSIDVS